MMTIYDKYDDDVDNDDGDDDNDEGCCFVNYAFDAAIGVVFVTA